VKGKKGGEKRTRLKNGRVGMLLTKIMKPVSRVGDKNAGQETRWANDGGDPRKKTRMGNMRASLPFEIGFQIPLPVKNG